MPNATQPATPAKKPPFTLYAEQFVPRPIDEVFPFYADAANLQQLTPDFLDFRILTPLPIEMRAGALIDYRISLHGFPMRWRTEITAWQPNNYFVDEQRKGPYSLWRHEHFFEPRDGGTAVIDKVGYNMFGGSLVNALLVRRDLTTIFTYRGEQLTRIFGAHAQTLRFDTR